MKADSHLQGFRGLVVLTLLVSMVALPVLAQPAKSGHDWYDYDEHTPGARYMEDGQRAYAAGQFGSALAKYKAAARWADKFAQYNIGVMHLRAEGVEFDPVKAWAWLELAAERDYPQMVEAADDLYAMLDEAQRAEGRDYLERELLPRYGDDARVEPTAQKMRQDRRRATGSRTGGGAFLSYLTIIDGSGQTRRGDEYYAAEKWDFERIIEYETQVMFRIANGNVELGELELVDDEEPEDGRE
jgi:hypothetical protein